MEYFLLSAEGINPIGKKRNTCHGMQFAYEFYSNVDGFAHALS
jgi:hypothetical protein